MTLQVHLSAETEAKLRQRAAASGQDLSAFVTEAVEEKLKAPERLSELLSPIHASTTRTGLSEDDIDTLIEQSRDERQAEHRPHRPA